MRMIGQTKLRVCAGFLPGIVAALLAGCSTTPPAEMRSEALAGDLKKRLAVVDFLDKTDYGKGRLGIAAADILEGELQRSGKFTMVSHSGMDEVLNLQAVGQSGVMDASTAMQAGRLIGANAIINGSVTEFGIKKSGVSVPGIIGTRTLVARAVVDVHLIDGTTGVILLSETGEGTAETTATKILNIGDEGTYDETLAGKALRGAIQSLVGKVVSRMETVPWQGYVLSEENGLVWITGGQDLGLRKGMQFEVTTLPKQVTAPNGKTYALPGQLKGALRVVEVMPDISQASLVHGVAVRNDLVRLPER
jgi:curli biogenesis system outer membrane secretion channel CsgG